MGRIKRIYTQCLYSCVSSKQNTTVVLKYRKLYKIGLVCGLTTLAVGLLIFLSWWTARAQFAIDLHRLEAYGFLWSLISIFIAGIGLIMMLIGLIINAPRYLVKNII